MVRGGEPRALYLTCVSAHEWASLPSVQVKYMVKVTADGDLVFHVVLIEHGAVAAHHCIATLAPKQVPAVADFLQVPGFVRIFQTVCIICLACSATITIFSAFNLISSLTCRYEPLMLALVLLSCMLLSLLFATLELLKFVAQLVLLVRILPGGGQWKRFVEIIESQKMHGQFSSELGRIYLDRLVGAVLFVFFLV